MRYNDHILTTLIFSNSNDSTKECTMELGKTISDIRRKHDLTQEEFAEKFNVTRQTISNWENGKSYPDLGTLVMMSETFNVSLDTMLKGDNRMVREMTKEQKHGRRHGLKLALAIVTALTVVATVMLIMSNTVTSLKPGDYTVTVKKITKENVTLDEVNKLAVYNDPEGGEYINEDETKDAGGTHDAAEPGSYVFEGEEYAELMTKGHAYELIVTSDSSIDGYFVDSDGSGPLTIDVWRSNTWFLNSSKQTRTVLIWFDDFDKICDSNTGDVVWEK